MAIGDLGGGNHDLAVATDEYGSVLLSDGAGPFGAQTKQVLLNKLQERGDQGMRALPLERLLEDIPE